MEIDDKLLKFRKTSSHQQNLAFESIKHKFNNFNTTIKNIFLNYFQFKNAKNEIETNLDRTDNHENLLIRKTRNSSARLRKINDPKQKIVLNEIESEKLIDQEPLKHYIIKLILRILLWATLFAIFVKLEFGIPYFIISLLIIIFLNTNVGRNKSKISAYSVFNPNLERIQGNYFIIKFYNII
jgi:hypothetical protein